ncbi:MAG: hypothetical protein K2M76_00585 [Muribaculaceae bacterium]|nr:hypothetical protein [Muribaculaceae bacterium]
MNKFHSIIILLVLCGWQCAFAQAGSMLRLDESNNRVHNEPVDYLGNMQTYLAGFWPGPIDMSRISKEELKREKRWSDDRFVCDVDPAIKTGGKDFIILNFAGCWSVVWRDSVGRFMFDKGTSREWESKTSIAFDTISVIANNELILKWAFDSLAYQYQNITPVLGYKSLDITMYTMYEAMGLYEAHTGKELFYQGIRSKGFLGSNSEQFNDRIDKLTALMYWLALMDVSVDRGIPNTNGQGVKYSKKHSVRRFKDGYSLRYMFWHKPYHPPVIRKRRFARGQHSSQ